MGSSILGTSFLKYNLKILAGKNYLIALLAIILLPCFYGFRLIDELGMMRVVEIFLSVIGIMIFGEIMGVEEDAIEEIIRSKKTDIVLIFITRIAISAVVTLSTCIVVAIYGRIGGGRFDLIKVIYGGWVSSITFGMLSITLFNLLHNVAAGYILVVSYYIYELMNRKGIIPQFFVMEMLNGKVEGKGRVLIFCLVLILVNCLLLRIKNKGGVV